MRGTVIDSRYEIVSPLGAGGMGTVFKAKHLDLNRIVAIKVLHPRFTADAAAVRRFQREARIISKLKHENILSVFGFGGFEGCVYLAMEFVEGTSLGQLIHTRLTLSPNEALPYLLQIADAMQHAHGNGVLHRDLKPDNVMMVVSSVSILSACVVDFGLAKLLDGSDLQRLTRTGEVVGDPRYMSPEQCQGEELDERSDVYSFGCLMYEVLTGQVPFHLDDPVAVMHKHVSAQPEPFAKKRGLPLSIESICLKAMAKNRAQRYDSFDSLKVDLQRFAKDPNVQIKVPKHKSGGLQAGKLNSIVIGALCLVAAIGVYGVLNWQIVSLQMGYRFAGTTAARSEASLALARYLADRTDFKEAMSLYRESKQLALENHNDILVMNANSGLAKSYMAQQLRDEARLAYLEVLQQGLDSLRQGRSRPEMDTLVFDALGAYAGLEPLPAVQLANELAIAFAGRKEPDRAKVVLMKVASVGSDQVRASTLFAMGKLCLQTGDRAGAQKYFDSAVATTPSLSGKVAVFQLAGAEGLARNDTDLASRYLAQAVDALDAPKQPKPEALLRLLADLHFKNKQYQSAQEYYAQSVRIAKNMPDPSWVQIGFTLDQLGQAAFECSNYKAAEQAFREELELLARTSPGNVQQIAWAHCKLANTLLREQEFDKASAEFEKSIRVIDGSPSTPELASMRRSIATYARAGESEQRSKLK